MTNFADVYNSLDLGKKATSLLYSRLCSRDRCFMCRTKFPEGIVLKTPGEFKPVDSSQHWFTGEFIQHMASTHGYNSLDLDMMLESIHLLGDIEEASMYLPQRI